MSARLPKQVRELPVRVWKRFWKPTVLRSGVM